MPEIKFSVEAENKISKILSRYPDRRSALIPVLYIAQEEFGFLSLEVMKCVAENLQIPEEYVINTATFYTLLNKDPVGKYHIQVCTNVSCYLRGCDKILERIKKSLGIEVGETTKDGKVTLNEVQCLASCGSAPAVEINDKYYEELNPQKVDEILKKITSDEL